MGIKSWIMLAIMAVASAAIDPTPTIEMVHNKTIIPTLTTMTTKTIPATLLPRDFSTYYSTPSAVYTPTAVTVRPFPTVRIDYHGLFIPKFKRFNPNSMYLPHTCPREALVALAAWRLFCDNKFIPYPFCWTRAPSIERCCGRWIMANDPNFREFPTWGAKFNETSQHWEADLNNKKHPGGREIIMQKYEDYNFKDDVCGLWRSENSRQWMHFTQHFGEYGIVEWTEYARILSPQVHYGP